MVRTHVSFIGRHVTTLTPFPDHEQKIKKKKGSSTRAHADFNTSFQLALTYTFNNAFRFSLQRIRRMNSTHQNPFRLLKRFRYRRESWNCNRYHQEKKSDVLFKAVGWSFRSTFRRRRRLRSHPPGWRTFARSRRP
jgi:hypothetical protein